MRNLDIICDQCKRKFGTAKVTYGLKFEMSAWSTMFKHTCMQCQWKT